MARLSPFYLALVTFERDFRRLPEYVATRLTGLSSIQRKCIAFLSMAHGFGQRSIPAQLFSSEFGLPQNRPVRLEELLPASTLELLVKSEPNKWRTVHRLVAEECMKQIFCRESADTRSWVNFLSNWSLEFINFCRTKGMVAPEEGLDLVSRVFVFRDNSEILGSERASTTRFSEALERIPVPEGRLVVLQRLTHCFPEQAHFWAHLGRFLSTVLKEHARALEAVDHSISLQPEDHVLHHMRGMVLRAMVYQLIDEQKDAKVLVERLRRPGTLS